MTLREPLAPSSAAQLSCSVDACSLLGSSQPGDDASPTVSEPALPATLVLPKATTYGSLRGLIVPTKGWKEEEGSNSATVKAEEIAVKQKDDYEVHFFNTPHANFISDEQKALKTSSPTLVSITQYPVANSGTYLVLVRTQNKDELIRIPEERVKKPSKATLARDKDLLKAFQETHLEGMKFLSVGPSSADLFLALGEELTTNSFKFGVLYVGPGQKLENEIYANQGQSKNFKHFLSILGEKIHLEGWTHYAGGLDTARSTTGTHSYYCRSEGLEIMYHVSTLLPYFPADEQQIERKRHIGNDIVVLVFVEDDQKTPFSADSLTSVFNHVYFVFHVCETDPSTGIASKYEISILSKPGVEKSLPSLPSPPIVSADRGIRDFVIFKAINLERASYNAPGFAPAIRRTRRDLITTLRNSVLQSSAAANLISTPRSGSMIAGLTPKKGSRFRKLF